MKRYLWISGLILTLICVLLGASLPGIIFAEEGKQTQSKVETYDVSEKKLSLTNSVVSVMNCVGSSDYSFKYQEELAVMTTDEVRQAVYDYMDGIGAENLGIASSDISESSDWDISCNMYIALDSRTQYDDPSTGVGTIADKVTDYDMEQSYREDSDSVGALTAVIWDVGIALDDESYIYFKVDDHNRKVIMEEKYSLYDKYRESSQDAEIVPIMTEDMTDFLGSYYDASVEVEDSDYDYAIFKLTDQEGASSFLYLYVNDKDISIDII